MRHTYTGKQVPWWSPTALWEGYMDGQSFAKNLPIDQLYRSPFYKRWLYWLGWTVAR